MIQSLQAVLRSLPRDHRLHSYGHLREETQMLSNFFLRYPHETEIDYLDIFRILQEEGAEWCMPRESLSTILKHLWPCLGIRRKNPTKERCGIYIVDRPSPLPAPILVKASQNFVASPAISRESFLPAANAASTGDAPMVIKRKRTSANSTAQRDMATAILRTALPDVPFSYHQACRFTNGVKGSDSSRVRALARLVIEGALVASGHAFNEKAALEGGGAPHAGVRFQMVENFDSAEIQKVLKSIPHRGMTLLKNRGNRGKKTLVAAAVPVSEIKKAPTVPVNSTAPSYLAVLRAKFEANEISREMYKELVRDELKLAI